MTNSQWPMTRDRGSACRLRPPNRTMPLRFLGPTLARTAGLDISHWALGIHWLLVIGHWSLPMSHARYFVNGPAHDEGVRRGPGRGGRLCLNSPLPGPLPARSSRGEGGDRPGHVQPPVHVEPPFAIAHTSGP